MKIEFIGVGEAFEPQLGNASYLIHSETKLLIDCGYAVPRNLFSRNYLPDYIDALYVTHFHADHTFGFPALINRWMEQKRVKPLIIIGQPGTENHLTKVIDLAYPSCLNRLTFEFNYIETVDPLFLNELQLSFALTDHGMKNYAIKVQCEGSRIAISGDGGITVATSKLFHNVHFLIHEAFGYKEAMKGHTNALDVIAFAKTLPHIKSLFLVHIQQEERLKFQKEFEALNNGTRFEVVLPTPGMVTDLNPDIS